MSTAAGDAPAPRTPTPSVKERTVALESELLRHTEATTSGGERNSVPSGTSQGGEKVGPDTPPGGAPSGSMTRADANGVDEAAASPVVVNVALMHDHRPDASRASLNGGKPRGAEAVDSEAVGYSDRDAAAAAATKPTDGDQRRPTSPTPTRVRMFPSGADGSPEPGWMRRMHLGESGARFSLPARWRPLVPWLPILLRGIQAVFSLVSVACVASMNHPAAMCEAMIADTDSLPASTVASLSALVDNAICLPGRNYKNFQSLEFLVVVTAATFVWSILFLLGDLTSLGYVGLGRIVGNAHVEPGDTSRPSRGVSMHQNSRAANEERARKFKIPALAFAGDASLAALTFSASCAVAGLRTGLDDLAAGYCERVGKGWCDRMAAACAFGFLASMSIVPSAALNTANKCGPCFLHRLVAFLLLHCSRSSATCVRAIKEHIVWSLIEPSWKNASNGVLVVLINFWKRDEAVVLVREGSIVTGASRYEPHLRCTVIMCPHH